MAGFHRIGPFSRFLNLSPQSSHQYKARIPPQKDGGIVRNIFAAQLTLINGRSRRGLRLWIARAMRSFPVPVSPEMSTVEPVGATTLTCLLCHDPINIPQCRNAFKNLECLGTGGTTFYRPEVESGSKVGGASAIAAPQLVLGESPMTNFNLAPFLNSSTVSHNFELGLPLIVML